jgi:hypothetical protein
VAEASCFQVGLEAIIPVNRESGTGIGVLAQLASLSRRNFQEEVRAVASRRRPGAFRSRFLLFTSRIMT